MTVRLHTGYRTEPNTYIVFYTENCIINQEDIVLAFPSEDFPRIPIVTRNLKTERSGDVGYGILRCEMELDSFILGNKHSEIVRKYLILENLVGRNDLYMKYVTNVGGDINNEHRVVYHERVYIDGIHQPTSWKQHDGDFKISLHYFINVCDINAFGIEASFDQFDLEIGGDGTSLYSYKFNPTPLYMSNVSRVNSSYTSSLKTPSGKILGKNKTITLSGILKADSYDNLKEKMDELEGAFSTHGVLNYGTWSMPCYVEEMPSFEQTLPHSHVRYTIKLKCYEDEIQEMQCSRNFSRQHRFLRVEDRLYCLKTEVEEFHASGQYVDYEIRLKAKNRQRARQLLDIELQSLISEGAYEVPGGSERWEDDRTIIVSIKKYYKEPILPNLDEDYYNNNQVTLGSTIPVGINVY